MSANSMTIIYSTAHKVPEEFRQRVFDKLKESAKDYPIVELHSTPEASSITNYYRELLVAAREIKTPFLSFAEDDTLYPDEHFNFRPSFDTFAYNFTRWNLYTWSSPPFYSLRQRKILATLIAPREKFIEVMEERIKLKESQMVEPGRRKGEKFETFNTYNPIVVFTHPNAFGYMNGGKKAHIIRATALPYWGEATKLMEIYK